METQNQQPAVQMPVVERKMVHHWVAIGVILAVALVIFVVAWWIFSREVMPVQPIPMPGLGFRAAPQVLPASDTAASINQSFEGIGSDALDQELQRIDQDLKNL